jgi:uncharacterized protein (DUF4415 family)
MNSKDLADEVIIEITEEEYQADLARGLEKDEVLQPGQHRFRRGGFLARHGLSPEQIATPVKAHITIDVDLDIITFFKERAAQTNVTSYQAQINHALRVFMEREQSDESMIAHSIT